jgi:hypothetical protein
LDVDLTTLKKKDGKKKDDLEQKWTPAQEELLAEWSEKATCFRWLHSRSEKAYRFRNYSYTIPVIILSTLTGTANFAMDSFVPEENKQIAMACVGGVNIFAGILSTLQNFLRYAELMESHRLCEVQWSKFGRNIAVELALDPMRRKPANDFLNVCRAEYDRLIEQSPPIDDPIINQFKSNFKNTDIRKPDICNGLDKCKIFSSSEEEKKADVVAAAGLKLLERKKPKKWNIPNEKDLKSDNHINKFNQNESGNHRKHDKIGFSVESTVESKKELDGLLTMNKVSQFKQSVNETMKIDEDQNPMDAINDIIKNSKNTDIEMGNDGENLKIEDSPIKENYYKSGKDDKSLEDNKSCKDDKSGKDDPSKKVELKINFLDKE